MYRETKVKFVFILCVVLFSLSSCDEGSFGEGYTQSYYEYFDDYEYYKDEVNRYENEFTEDEERLEESLRYSAAIEDGLSDVWQFYSKYAVFVNESDNTYHSYGCSYLENCDNEYTRSDADAKGYKPYDLCLQ